MSRYDRSALLCLIITVGLALTAGPRVALMAACAAGCLVGLRLGGWLLIGGWRRQHDTDPYARYPKQPAPGWLVSATLFEGLLILAVGLGAGIMFVSFVGVV